MYLEWRIELIARVLRNNADGWLPSFIVDLLLLSAGWSALTYLTSSGRCRHHSRCPHAKSFCTHLQFYTESWLRSWLSFSSVSELRRSMCMYNSMNDRNQCLKCTQRNTSDLFQYIGAFIWKGTRIWYWNKRAVGWNCMKPKHTIHRHKLLPNELRSERANAWAKWGARAKWASKWVSGASNWAERKSKWLST